MSREEWLDARRQLLAIEKEFTRPRDAPNAGRRRLPMVEIGKEYVFEGSDGQATRPGLSSGRGHPGPGQPAATAGRASSGTCGWLVYKPVDNRGEVRISDPALWVSCG